MLRTEICLGVIVLVGFVVVDTNTDEKPGGSYVYNDTRPSQMGFKPTWDTNGYALFCLCMGRLGNQVEHFLGGMAFAAALNRTLVLPPFRTYRNVRFTEWFRFDAIAAHQKVILAEDFMEFLAPEHWPPEDRIGFCWLPPSTQETDCSMKEGNPFGPFWDGLNIDFTHSIIYHLTYSDRDIPQWNKQYPPSVYPVLAMRGAPASFPVRSEHRHLQRHLVFSRRVDDEAQKYIDEHFPRKKFIGIHLRNGADWCLETTAGLVTDELCLPSKEEIFRLLKHVLSLSKAKVVFVATDQNPMISDIEEHFKKQKVKVFHADPWLPTIDWAILIKSDHFVGNCVSSFTSFVKRARDLAGKPTYFWGFDFFNL